MQSIKQNLWNSFQVFGIKYDMNIIFTVLIIASIIMICISSPENALGFMLEGTSEAVRLTIKLIAIYSLWTGLIKIMEDSGIKQKFAKMLSPLTKRIFKGESEEAQTMIAMNFTANMIGMGGAATSMGIKATSLMGENKSKITKNMMLFFIINISSIQILPTTVITLRASAGSVSPSDIILPGLIASLFTTVVGVVLVLVIEKIRNSVKRKSKIKIRKAKK